MTSTYDKKEWAEMMQDVNANIPPAGAGFWSTAGSLLTGDSGTWTKVNDSLGKQFSAMGPMLAISGAVNSAIGNYYSAKSQEAQLESQASTLAFQSRMAVINQRQMEFQAQNIMMSGQQKASMLSLRSGQQKSSARASMAARGVALNVGSTAELEVSHDLMKEIDMLTINAETVRSAEAARMAGVGYGNQATMLSASSQNVRDTASSLSPLGGAFTSLMGSASSLSSAWYQDRKLAALIGRMPATN